MRKDMRDKTVFNYGQRMTMLRKEKGLSQKDFCEAFSEFCGLTKPITIPAVSSWEQNRRLPGMGFVLQMALYFNVSLDYLFGLTDQRNDTGSQEKQAQISEFVKTAELPIADDDLPLYNGMPVYCKFRNNTHLNQWGILNHNKNRVICKDFAVHLSPEVSCYPLGPIKPIRTQIYTLEQMLNTNYLWIEMKSSDPAVAAEYNGRYAHGPGKKFLVRIGDNTVLPYSGLDVSYWAFKA